MPYNPGISHDFSPIAQGLANLGANVRQFAEKRKAEANETKTLRKLAAIYAPDQKDQFETMGLADLRGEAQRFAITQAQKKMQMETDRMAFDQRQAEEQGGRADQYLALQKAFALENEKKQQASDQTNQAFTKFAQEFASGPPAVLRPDLFDQANTQEGRLNYALQRNPKAAAHQNFSEVARFAERNTGRPEPYEDPVSGQRFTIFGKQIMPAGVNPDRMTGKAIPATDENGDPIPGKSILYDARGIPRVITTPQARVKDKAGPLGGPEFTGTKAEYDAWMAEKAKQQPPATPKKESLMDKIASWLSGSKKDEIPKQEKTEAAKDEIIRMTNPKGQIVNVPKHLADELREKKGYK